MNKTELINNVAEKAAISKNAAKTAIEAFTDTIMCTLQKNEKVVIVGFGTFSTTIRKARIGRNPKTGGRIEIPQKTIAKFKPGKEFKEAVNR